MSAPQTLNDVTLGELPLMSVIELKTLCKNTVDLQKSEEFEDFGKPELEKIAKAYIEKKIGIAPVQKAPEVNHPILGDAPHADFPHLTNDEAEDPVALFEKMGYSDKRSILVDIETVRRERKQLEFLQGEQKKREEELVRKEREMEGREVSFNEKMKELGIRKKQNQDLLDKIVAAKKAATADIKL